jgi:hypothetical protein
LHRKCQSVRRPGITDDNVNIFRLEGGGIPFFDWLDSLFRLLIIIFPDLNAEKPGVGRFVRYIINVCIFHDAHLGEQQRQRLTLTFSFFSFASAWE